MWGSTRSNASAGSPPWDRGSASGEAIRVNSAIDPGQPWVMISGVASGSGERTWAKWMLAPSIVVVNCGHSFSRASAARQSYSCRQYRTSSLR
jgi:hypothetical protein